MVNIEFDVILASNLVIILQNIGIMTQNKLTKGLNMSNKREDDPSC